MRKPLHASLLTLLTIGGAILAGYIVAFMLTGQTPRKAALAAMTMDVASKRQFAVPVATPSALPAPRFEVLGAAPEPRQATAATATPRTALASAVPSGAAASSSAAPFPTLNPRSQTASAAGRSDAPTATSTTTFASEGFDSALSGWPVRPLAGWSGGYENGRYVVRVEGEQPIGIAYPVTVDNFRLAADVAVESGAAGLVFMYQKPASFLWVGVDAEGSAGVERFDGEKITTIVPWRPVERPAAAGATIRIEVERRGNRLTVTCGGRQLAVFDAPDGTWDNRYGFVVAPRDGVGAAGFDNLVGDRIP